VPAVLALVVFAAAFFAWKHFFFPPTSVDVAHVSTRVLPIVTQYHTDTIVIGPNETNSTLLVASTIRVENHRTVPISLDDFTLTLTDTTGAELMQKAVEKQELPNLATMFPKVTPMLGTQLLRDTSIAPGKSAEGTLIFSFPAPQTIWDARKSAVIAVAVYHEPAVSVEIPK
jgi:hypothetical protein